jgi:hypothetical protein
VRAVVKLGRARAFVRRHFLGVLERAAVGKIGGDAGRAKGVAADRCRDAGRRGAPADHPPRGVLIHRAVRQDIGVLPGRAAEQPALTVLGDLGRIDIGMSASASA